LRAEPLRIEIEQAGDDHAERGDLRQREIDEHDAAAQDLHPERHVRDQHQHAGDQGWRDDRQVEQRGCAHFSAPSSRCRMSS